jgi:hypothetical protein
VQSHKTKKPAVKHAFLSLVVHRALGSIYRNLVKVSADTVGMRIRIGK